MFDLFSDFFALRTSVLARIDERVKLLCSLTCIVFILISNGMLFPSIILFFCISTMLWLRIPIKLLLVRLFAPIVMVLVLVIIQSLTIGTTPFAEFNVLDYVITIKTEGIVSGLLMGSRVLGSVSVLLLLGFTTPAYKIFHALRWFGIPETWVETALLVYRYIFCLIDQIVDVASAQQIRLGYSSLPKSVHSFSLLAGTVLIRSMDQAMRTHEAMTLRGYTGKMPFIPLPRLSYFSIGAVIAFLIGISALYFFAEQVIL